MLNSHSLRNYKNYSPHNFFNKSADFSKMFDLKRRTLKTFIMNRQILKNSLFLKSYRQSNLTKFIVKNSRRNTLEFVRQYENSLAGLLVKSKLTTTLNDSIFLIKNNFVFKNGVICYEPFTLINTFDVINLVFTEKYFYFFKFLLNSSIKMSSHLSYRL